MDRTGAWVTQRDPFSKSFNATDVPFPEHRLIHQLFEERAAEVPDSVALVCADQKSLTYSELDAEASRVARYLAGQGVRAGELVPVLMGRSARLIIAILAILKCGAAYVPTDPAQPQKRHLHLIRDCGARRVISDLPRVEGLEEDVQWIDLADSKGSTASADVRVPDGSVDALSPAYVMYTSGSTGLPKGAIVTHRAIARLIVNNNYVDIKASDCIAHASNPAFDASTFEIWGALLNGARLAIAPPSLELEPARFAQFLRESGVTILWMTVGLVAQYSETLASVFSGLRYLITGGDVVEPELIRRILRKGRPRCLLSAYGPTECTTFSTIYEVVSIDENVSRIPIGRPISNTYVYILDADLQPVSIGVTGEICIGGPGVALGYLNRPELTAARFIPDPFRQAPGARLYRTGDLGYWNPDGTIEFLGRNDEQVKIRGFRIEPGEIEVALRGCAEVEQALVICREDNPGEKRLVGYVVADPSFSQQPGARSALLQKLREHLKDQLPPFMVPHALILLESFPLTTNGKFDRRALPPPEMAECGDQMSDDPRGATEDALAQIWTELLGLKHVTRESHFFDLGGDSLAAMRLASRVTDRLGVQLQAHAVFRYPTLREMAQVTEGLLRVEHPADTRSRIVG